MKKRKINGNSEENKGSKLENKKFLVNFFFSLIYSCIKWWRNTIVVLS